MTLIVYASKHDTVTKCANILAEKLADKCTLINIKNQSIPSLDSYSALILGFSIHAGSVQKSIVNFSKNHISQLRAKDFGLFCSCLSNENQAIAYFHRNFPADVINAAKTIGIFGGAIYFEKMNFMERFVMKRITHKKGNFSTINEINIDEFVRLFEQNLT